MIIIGHVQFRSSAIVYLSYLYIRMYNAYVKYERARELSGAYRAQM